MKTLWCKRERNVLADVMRRDEVISRGSTERERERERDVMDNFHSPSGRRTSIEQVPRAGSAKHGRPRCVYQIPPGQVASIKPVLAAFRLCV